MVMSREELKAIFTPELQKFIATCIREGLSIYDNPANYGIEACRDHTPSVRAAIRNCHIVACTHRALVDRSDIRVVNKGNRVLFIIADKIRVSFKKLDKKLRSRNYPTRQALKFTAQEPLFKDEKQGELTNVVAGYKHNDTETDYEIFVTCPLDTYNHWQLKLFGAEILDFFPISENASGAELVADKIQPKPRRVRVRTELQRKDKANE